MGQDFRSAAGGAPSVGSSMQDHKSARLIASMRASLHRLSHLSAPCGEGCKRGTASLSGGRLATAIMLRLAVVDIDAENLKLGVVTLALHLPSGASSAPGPPP